jgi:hypothetical protein
LHGQPLSALIGFKPFSPVKKPLESDAAGIGEFEGRDPQMGDWGQSAPNNQRLIQFEAVDNSVALYISL